MAKEFMKMSSMCSVPVHSLLHGLVERPRLFAREVVSVGWSDCGANKSQHYDWQ
jgi:hypothetical protein